MSRAGRLLEQDDRILAAITKAAERGQPCPQNGELARMIGASSKSVPVNAMKRLEERGLIVVERFSMSRIVTIVATGKSTGGHPATPHWRVHLRDGDVSMPIDHKAQPVPAAPVPAVHSRPEPVRVNRDPCPFCEIRGDIGCRHSRAAPRITFVPVHLHAAEVTQL
ncbi:winged helix-turn-helix domain-containing protein [Novosphingobium guangzhouense]|nr:winged helix-turn-helix domain-containing protein [Novosphingobium guangzhouense]